MFEPHRENHVLFGYVVLHLVGDDVGFGLQLVLEDLASVIADLEFYGLPGGGSWRWVGGGPAGRDDLEGLGGLLEGRVLVVVAVLNLPLHFGLFYLNY